MGSAPGGFGEPPCKSRLLLEFAAREVLVTEGKIPHRLYLFRFNMADTGHICLSYDTDATTDIHCHDESSRLQQVTAPSAFSVSDMATACSRIPCCRSASAVRGYERE